MVALTAAFALVLLTIYGLAKALICIWLLPARRSASAVFVTTTCLSVCLSVRHTPVLFLNG